MEPNTKKEPSLTWIEKLFGLIFLGIGILGIIIYIYVRWMGL